MSKHLFVLSAGANDAIRMAACFRFAKCAVEEGHEVVMVLSDDAIYLATNPAMFDQVVTPTGDTIHEHMEVLRNGPVEWLVCGRCAKARKIMADDLPEGWRMVKPHAAIQLVEAGARQWTF